MIKRKISPMIISSLGFLESNSHPGKNNNEIPNKLEAKTMETRKGRDNKSTNNIQE